MGSVEVVSARSSPSLHVGTVLRHLFLLLIASTAIGPVVILFLNAFRTTTDIQNMPIGMPSQIIWENFPAAWHSASFGVAFRNSLLVSAASVIAVCLISSCSAYALTRLRPRGATAIGTYYLFAMTVPAQLYLVPLFFIWARLNLTGSLIGLIIIYWAIYLPFSIFLLRAYFLSLPQELEDAARVDGCSELQVLVHIILPLSSPILFTLAVIISVWTWNEFLFATTMLQAPELHTVALSFVAFTSAWESDFAQQSAAAMIVAVPVIILFLLLQRQFIQGMMEGGLKF